jgi:hypothetical protein
MPHSLTHRLTSFSVRRGHHPPLVALLLFLLLSMQALVLQHQLDPAHHHDGNTCEICLHISPLDHGLITTQSLPRLALFAPPPETRIWLQPPSLHHTAYHSRAPPRFS